MVQIVIKAQLVNISSMDGINPTSPSMLIGIFTSIIFFLMWWSGSNMKKEQLDNLADRRTPLDRMRAAQYAAGQRVLVTRDD